MRPNVLFALLGTSCVTEGEATFPEDTAAGAAATKSIYPASDLPIADQEEILDYIDSRYEGIEVVETVVDATGQAFDCVPAERQPGLRRTDSSTGEVYFQSFAGVPDDVLAEARRLSERPNASPEESSAGALRVACPSGSVPFKQPSYEAIASFGSLENYLERYWEAPLVTGHEYGVTQYAGDNTGGAAVFNIWDPAVATSYEFSLAQIWVSRGSGGDLQTLEAGWQDSPSRTGSLNPKFFVYSTQDNYASHGSGDCYDQDCDDWVQVSSELAPGFGWSNHSAPGGAQYVFDISWYRAVNSHWYLIYKGDVLGYYPNSLFDTNGLANKASRLDFGGEVAVDNTLMHSGTDMGSGAFPSAGFGYASYVRTLERRSTALLTWTAVPLVSLAETATDANCYDVSAASGTTPWDTHFYFGGRGYHLVDCP